MAEEVEKRTPPYIAFKTFENFINGLGETAVPHKVDSSLLRTMSGSARSGLMVSLRYLGLIDENDNTKPALEKLAHSKGDERKAALTELIRGSYRFMTKLDLTRATPAQLADAIGDEGATGGTRDKAVAFFLKAGESAGLAISPHITKRKHAAPANGKPRTKRNVKPAKQTPKGGQKDREDDLDERVTAQSPYEVLMNDIYDPSKMKAGSEEEKAVFTLARFLRSRDA